MGRKLLWGLVTLLAAIVAADSLSSALVPSIRTPFVQALIAQKTLRTYGHLLGGGVSILAGAFQFNATLRDRRPAVHRMLGRIYLTSVVIGGFGGPVWPPHRAEGATAHLGFALLALGWLGTSGIAYRRALEGERPAS